MDTIEKLEQRADNMSFAIADWETKAMAEIGKEIKKIGSKSKAEAEKYDVKTATDAVWATIVSSLAVATALNIRSLKKTYSDAFAEWHEANRYLYNYRGVDFTAADKNGGIQDIIKEYVWQNGKDIINLTQTKALSVVDPYGKVIRFQDAIYKAFGEAVGYVKDGKIDFHTSMRKTIETLGGGGCRIDYGGGITRRLDTVVRQNMLYGTKQAHREYNELIGKELRCDGIEIDYHANPRPSHEFMQGKQYSKGDAKTVNGVHYPSAEKSGVYDRLYKDYNCLHYETDIILGVSEPRYTEEELARLKERDARVFDIDGKQMTGYEASQAMRRIETEVRKQKDIRNMASAAGDDLLVRRCSSRIKAFKAKYEEISRTTGIAKETRRMSVGKPQKGLTNGGNSGTMLLNNEVGELAVPYPMDKIPTKIKKYIDQTTEYGSVLQVDFPISFEDIGLLSRQTSTEFASISIGENHYIIKGDRTGTPLPSDFFVKKGLLNCHSHPYIGDVRPSPEDLSVARMMNWQEEFYIVSPDGKYSTYNTSGIVGTQNVSRSMTSEEGLKIYDELFKEV